jgi:hypothetical protein
MALAQEEYLIAAPQMEVVDRLRRSATRLRWNIREEAGSLLFFQRRGRQGAWLSGQGSRLAASLRPEGDRTIARLTAWGGAESDPHASIWHVLADAGLAASLLEPGAQSARPRLAGRARGVTPWWAKPLNLMQWYGVVPLCVAVPLMLEVLPGWYRAGLATLLIWLVLIPVPVALEDILARRMTGVRSRQGVLPAAAVSAAWGGAVGLFVWAVARAIH